MFGSFLMLTNQPTQVGQAQGGANLAASGGADWGAVGGWPNMANQHETIIEWCVSW